MKRRRTRKDWYQFHLEKAQREEKAQVEKEFGSDLREAKEAQQAAWKAYTEAREHEPLASRLGAFVGSESAYRREVLNPLRDDARIADRALSDATVRHRALLKEAEKRGAENYLEAREARKLEEEARAQRVAQRKYERRLKYLEQSPAIRSASRPLKDHLIKEQSEDGETIVCFYCEQVIPVGESHLEHKKPISRGGTNSRRNLVLSCAPCNLRKGKKTHEEFLNYLGRKDL